jgi:hypothetical protein
LETVFGEAAASALSEESAADRAPSRQADTSTSSVHQEHTAEGTGDDAMNSVETMEPELVISDMAGDASPSEVSLSNQWLRRTATCAHSRLV